MLNKLTWKDLLTFLQKLEDGGNLPTEDDVVWHNLETGDEAPCETVYLENKRLVLATNWDVVNKENWK